MKNHIHYLPLLAILILLTHCMPSGSERTAGHVIIIGIDGMSPDGIQNAETPHMDALMEKGSWSMQARGVLPTSSSPNWASMIMGAGPEQHGITSNSWRVDQHILPASVTSTEAYFPTIFRIIEDQNPEYKTSTYYHWTGFQNLFDRTDPDVEVNGASEEATTDGAVEHILNEKPDFLFVHIDHVDGAGHGQGHGSPAYYESVSKADSLIGLIMKATVDAGIADETVIIVSADHGGVGYGHGGETPEEINIPWIAYGKGIREGYQIRHSINTYDTPSTAAYLLGIEQPHVWIGRPVAGALKNMAVPESEYGVAEYARNPVIYPNYIDNSPSGGLFTDGKATVKMENPNEFGELRYTTDGSDPTAQSTRYTESFEIDENTVIRAAVFENDKPKSRIADAYFRVIQPDHPKGVRFTTFTKDEMTMLPDFSSMKSVSSGTTYEFSLDGIELPREDQVAMVMETVITLPVDGEYHFSVASDDGSKLYLNDKEFVNNDGDHGVIEKQSSAELKAGEHKLRVEWFNGGGGKWLGAYIEGPGIPRQIIPPTMLSLNGE